MRAPRLRLSLRSLCWLGAMGALLGAAAPARPQHRSDPTQIVVDRQHVVARFDPRIAFGATIDAHRHGENAAIFTRKNVEAMLSAGFQPLSYRLETELSGEAWHWNPKGAWSDTTRREGYWVSSDRAGAPIELSYGYRLPRRGNTIDQAHNDSYSRIDDGDDTTFWKSNPYLDEHFTRRSYELEPQWILVDLGKRTAVDAIRVAWGVPYATAYRLEWWSGDDPIDSPAAGTWTTFRNGVVNEARGGDRLTHLGERRDVRFVRVVMTHSSGTGGGTDLRDRLGFAVREVGVGLRAAGGQRSSGDRAPGSLLDRVRHGRGRTQQSVIWVSSTDPWHRAVDIDRNSEQLGLDAVYASDLTRGLGVIVPVSMLYGVPEDSAAEMRYLRMRHHRISFVEMGEEPDGQAISPEAYAALFEQWSAALHAVDPSLRLGGPCFQSTNDIVAFWSDERHRGTSWIGRFAGRLRSDGRLAELAFLSFEWYPFDNLCVPPEQQLIEAPSLLARVLRAWRKEGAPTSIPWIATEYGYSSYAGEPEVDLHGAILNADFAADLLYLGGSASYFYGYEPEVLIREQRCPTWGNLALFRSDKRHRIQQPLATYYAARMLTTEWAGATGEQTMHSVRLEPATPTVTAYSVQRGEGQYALLLFNKDATSERRVTISDDRGTSHPPLFPGKVDLIQYSRRQYQWHPAGARGFAEPDDRPEQRLSVDGRAEFTLPSLSITVIRGAVAADPR